jgi:hypothetical protein
MKKVFLLLLLSFAMYSQSTIVAAGGDNSGSGGNVSYSIGQLFTNSVTVQEGVQIAKIEQEQSLSIPKFEIEPPKPTSVVKKETFMQKLLNFFNKIFKNKKL